MRELKEVSEGICQIRRAGQEEGGLRRRKNPQRLASLQSPVNKLLHYFWVFLDLKTFLVSYSGAKWHDSAPLRIPWTYGVVFRDGMFILTIQLSVCRDGACTEHLNGLGHVMFIQFLNAIARLPAHPAKISSADNPTERRLVNQRQYIQNHHFFHKKVMLAGGTRSEMSHSNYLI